MHQLLHLGAINKKTRKYVYPTITTKKCDEGTKVNKNVRCNVELGTGV
jgi:hypothetical protein